MLTIKIVIDGRNADESAEDLSQKITSKILPKKYDKDGKRSSDLQAIVEFVNQIKPLITTAGTVIGTAYTIWKWRKDLKSKNDVLIKKQNEDGSEEEKKLKRDTTVEEIEDFLELKPLPKKENI